MSIAYRIGVVLKWISLPLCAASAVFTGYFGIGVWHASNRPEKPPQDPLSKDAGALELAGRGIEATGDFLRSVGDIATFMLFEFGLAVLAGALLLYGLSFLLRRRRPTSPAAEPSPRPPSAP